MIIIPLLVIIVTFVWLTGGRWEEKGAVWPSFLPKWVRFLQNDWGWAPALQKVKRARNPVFSSKMSLVDDPAGNWKRAAKSVCLGPKSLCFLLAEFRCFSSGFLGSRSVIYIQKHRTQEYLLWTTKSLQRVFFGGKMSMFLLRRNQQKMVLFWQISSKMSQEDKKWVWLIRGPKTSFLWEFGNK